jgi:hypothetical protein
MQAEDAPVDNNNRELRVRLDNELRRKFQENVLNTRDDPKCRRLPEGEIYSAW